MQNVNKNEYLNRTNNYSFLNQIFLKGKPEPVRNLKVINASISSIPLRWSPGYDGGETQSFLIDYRQLPDGNYNDAVTVPSSVTKYTIKNLLEDTRYEIRVRSKNVNGINEQTVPGMTLCEYISLFLINSIQLFPPSWCIKFSQNFV